VSESTPLETKWSSRSIQTSFSAVPLDIAEIPDSPSSQPSSAVPLDTMQIPNIPSSRPISTASGRVPASRGSVFEQAVAGLPF
jgi:hypothetical protein